MLKKIKISFICFLGLFTTAVSASEATDRADRLMDWAESVFYEFFSPGGQSSQTINFDDPASPFFGRWYYRQYPQTNDFIALKNETDIYVLGGVFGGELKFINGLDKLVANLPEKGNCANVPLPTAGAVAEYKIKNPVDNLDGTLVATIKESSPTKLLIEQQIIGDNSAVKTTETSTFKIVDNFLFESKNITASDQTGFNITSTFDYAPEILRGPRLVYCQGESWQSKASTATSSTTPSLGLSRPTPAPLSRGKVNAVNIEIDLPVGKVKIVKETIYDDDGERTERWTAIDSGLLVLEKITNQESILTSIQTLERIR